MYGFLLRCRGIYSSYENVSCYRCNVASLLMVAFQAKMEYATE